MNTTAPDSNPGIRDDQDMGPSMWYIEGLYRSLEKAAYGTGPQHRPAAAVVETRRDDDAG